MTKTKSELSLPVSFIVQYPDIQAHQILTKRSYALDYRQKTASSPDSE